jgi:hypothetical protein
MDIESLYDEVIQLLENEELTDNFDLKHFYISDAIAKSSFLLRHNPNSANFHHLLGLCWYQYPDWSPERSTSIRKYLQNALSIDPFHHFANQYLGYINFDETYYEAALKYFNATNHEFFISIDQKWRSLKSTELAIVCKLRLGQTVDTSTLNSFFEDYLTEENRDIPNTVVTLELRRYAESRFDQLQDIKGEPLNSILKFLDAAGDLGRSEHMGLKSSWSSFLGAKGGV